MINPPPAAQAPLVENLLTHQPDLRLAAAREHPEQLQASTVGAAQLCRLRPQSLLDTPQALLGNPIETIRRYQQPPEAVVGTAVIVMLHPMTNPTGGIGQGVILNGTVNNEGRIETALGSVDGGHLRKDLIAGTQVEMLVRPDDLVPDDDGDLKLEVVDKAFRGAEYLYTLKLDDGTEVLSLMPSHHNHPVGARIGVRLDIGHLVVFPI